MRRLRPELAAYEGWQDSMAAPGFWTILSHNINKDRLNNLRSELNGNRLEG